MQISDYFIKGDMKGAIEYMRSHEEYDEFLPLYTAIFENCEYRTYEVPECLNDILRQYQVYFRDVFYRGLAETEASDRLLARLGELTGMPGADEDELAGRLEQIFKENGYHALFGKTQGHFGPYIWKETVPASYSVELPDGTAEYTVNVLKGFVFRSWMDYLTFGEHGTGGWASKDGTLNCVEQAYDFESDAFLGSFLKHEAQHARDMKKYPGITETELEYRAKLVELIYRRDAGLLQKFISEADENRKHDGHAMASARIEKGFAGIDQNNLTAIQTRALELYCSDTDEMDRKYRVSAD